VQPLHPRTLGKWLVRIAGGAAFVWALAAARIGPTVAPFLSANLERLPATRVGLVLGCSPHLADGRKNLFFERRIAAAAALFRAGKVQYLLVSGDNSRPDYDEPSAMRAALVVAGVPEPRIVRDFAGFRTLDSVARAQSVFGLSELIVVSQRFHNERAVYLARARGLKAFGYDAGDVGGVHGLRTHAREVLSRLVAVLEVELLHTAPRYPGPPEPNPFGVVI
jgi:SanA protein